MRKPVVILLLVLPYLFTTLKADASDQKITIYTEHFPPYSYRSAEGDVAGAATKLVRQIMDASGLPYEISLGPWARIIRDAQTNHSSLIYSIANTPERSLQFDWIALLSTEDYFLIGRHNDNRTITNASIRKGDYTAVCLVADISCLLLKISGFPERSVVRFSSLGSSDNVASMMLQGRADFYLGTRYRHTAVLKRLGLNTDIVKLKKHLGQLDFYLAAGKQVDVKVKATVINSYRTLLKEGLYTKLDPKKIHENEINSKY